MPSARARLRLPWPTAPESDFARELLEEGCRARKVLRLAIEILVVPAGGDAGMCEKIGSAVLSCSMPTSLGLFACVGSAMAWFLRLVFGV